MTITWEGLAALCAFVALIGAGLFGAMKMMLNAALLDFEHRFFERLNGRYVKTELCVALHREIDRRLEARKV